MAYLSMVDAAVSDAEQQRRGCRSTNSHWSKPLNQLGTSEKGFGMLSHPNVDPLGEQLFRQFADQAPNHLANEVASHIARQQVMERLSLLEQQAQSQMHRDQMVKWLGAAAFEHQTAASRAHMPAKATSTAVPADLFAAAISAEMAGLSDNPGGAPTRSSPLVAMSGKRASPAKAMAEDYIGIAGLLSNVTEQLQVLESRMQRISKA